MQKKRKFRVRPFRIMAGVLGAAALVMLAKFPAKAMSLQRQQEQLQIASDEYYAAKAQNNQLSAELAEINTDDFIERTARREYGYCWYGETVYTVGNLDDIRSESDIEVYEGQE